MILKIRKKINGEIQTVKVLGGNFAFLFNEELKRLFIQIDDVTFNMPCKNLKYSVHGNIVFAETE